MAPSVADGEIVDDLKLPQHIPEASHAAGAKFAVPNLFSLANKTIAVTGGGGGLGIELASAILEAGACIACLDILPQPSEEEWSAILKAAASTNLSATYHKCDITNEEEVSQILDSVAERADEAGAPFWGIVTCAGIQQQVPALEYKVEDFERILRVNVTGSFLSAKHTARQLVKRNRIGSIVLIASMSGQIANRSLFCSAYNTSKAAVHQMCRSFAQEWGTYGIRINTLSPGYIRTKMTDKLLEEKPELEKAWMAGALLGRLGAPQDFRAPAVFLLAEGSGWMTGADLRVDGGNCATA